MKKTNPITPSEAKLKKNQSIPNEVIEVFNEMIVEKMGNSGESSFTQKEVQARICKRLKVKPEVLFENHWLDVEDIFRKSGWKVEFDQPGYNETYEATFSFRSKN